MRRITTFAVVTALLLGWSDPTIAEEAIPTRFVFPVHEDTIWIAASDAITAEGIVRPGVLRETHRNELLRRREYLRERRARAAAEVAPDPDPCDAQFIGATEFSDGWPLRSIAELQEVASSHPVIAGVVTASAVGFHAGRPHTVLRIETAPPTVDRIVYLLYPDGRIRFEGMLVCNHDPGFAPPPATGDPITFVAASAAFDASRTLYVTAGSWILYEREGAVVAGRSLQQDASLKRHSLGEITRLLRGVALPAQ